MVIWDRKALPPELAVEVVPGTIYGLSDKGWMDQEWFNMWFHKHFLKYALPATPLLLLMDGHSSHFCPATIRCAAQDYLHFHPTQLILHSHWIRLSLVPLKCVGEKHAIISSSRILECVLRKFTFLPCLVRHGSKL